MRAGCSLKKPVGVVSTPWLKAKRSVRFTVWDPDRGISCAYEFPVLVCEVFFDNTNRYITHYGQGLVALR